jgi:hypothetical protein
VEVARGDVHTQFRQRFPAAHERLIREELRDCYEEVDLLVSHTGFDPISPSDRSRRALVQTSHPTIFEEDTQQSLGSALVVCGHYAQRSGEPYVSRKLICVDTGCGTYGGPLTAVLLPERRFLQV